LSHALLLSPGLPLALCQRCPDGGSHSHVRLGRLVERRHVLSATLQKQIARPWTAIPEARDRHTHPHTEREKDRDRPREREREREREGEREREIEREQAPHTQRKRGGRARVRVIARINTCGRGLWQAILPGWSNKVLKDVQLFNIVSMMICLDYPGVVKIRKCAFTSSPVRTCNWYMFRLAW
jgi:hypothetical protein